MASFPAGKSVSGLGGASPNTNPPARLRVGTELALGGLCCAASLPCPYTQDTCGVIPLHCWGVLGALLSPIHSRGGTTRPGEQGAIRQRDPQLSIRNASLSPCTLGDQLHQLKPKDNFILHCKIFPPPRDHDAVRGSGVALLRAAEEPPFHPMAPSCCCVKSALLLHGAPGLFMLRAGRGC